MPCIEKQPLQKLLYDRKSAAFMLSISTRSLDHLIANKQLSFRKLGKKVMIPAAELARFARMDHACLTATPTETSKVVTPEQEAGDEILSRVRSQIESSIKC